MAHRPWMLFVDGENFTFRAQKVAEQEGISLKEGVFYLPDQFLWIPEAPPLQFLFLNALRPMPPHYLEEKAIRAYYYASVAGDHNKVESVKEKLWFLGFQPEVFKKAKKEEKAKGIDIALSKDFLSLAYTNSYDIACLVAGDGDYVPLLNEVKRLGKIVYVAFFSQSGLNPDLRMASDRFLDLSGLFTENWRKLK